MLKKFEPFEPVRDGRFILKMIGYEISEWLVRSYRFYNDGDKLMIDVKIIEAVIFIIEPTKLFDIEGIQLTFLDPTGVAYMQHTFSIKGMNFEHISDYGVNDISNYNFVFEVDRDSYKTENLKGVIEKNI
jgi:hypothetical protein